MNTLPDTVIEPKPKRKETRSAICVAPALWERFRAARDTHRTTTPGLLTAFLNHFDTLTVEQQGALIRGDWIK